MTQPIDPTDLAHLSIPERILLVEKIWDSIADDQESLPVTQQQRDELDRRLQSRRDHPNDGKPWEEVRDRLQGES